MFIDKLNHAWRQQNSLVCVGLDPDVSRLPANITGSEPLFRFNRAIIDACAEFACAFKPQIAYYAALGAERELSLSIDYIQKNYPHLPIILDAKRGDIGATAAMYAREAFERYGADAVTVNPYMGGDTLQPFLDYRDKGVIILCRTSNPGSGDIQELESDGCRIAMHVARLASTQWNQNNNVALVVGATWPDEIAAVRAQVGDMPLLIPGVGAQGGDMEAVLTNGLASDGYGLVINASRSIIYASDGKDFAAAAADETHRMRDQINQIRERIVA